MGRQPHVAQKGLDDKYDEESRSKKELNIIPI